MVSNPDGSGAQVVEANPTGTAVNTPYTTYITPADLSPDGQQIAFSVNPGAPVPHTNQLDIAAVDGGAPRQLAAPAYNPRWSPDGTKIAYSMFRTETQLNAVFIANADGSGAHMVAPDGVDPTWSPDGTQLAFTTTNGGSIKTVDVNGSGLRTLGPGRNAVWSPTSNRIAFNSGTADVPQITIENSDGSKAQVVPGANGTLDDWDPSGTRLLVSIGSGPITIEVVDATSGARDGIVTTSALYPEASWQRPR